MDEPEPLVSGAESPAGFDAVDRSGDAEAYVRFLEAQDAMPELVAWRRKGYAALELRSDLHLVDVGCGIGTATVELAQMVGPGGRALGVDISEVMLAEARRRAAAAESRAQFELGAAADLPLADGAVQGYRAERVYQHVHDPAAALAEAHRVLAPGGRLVIQDSDHGTVAFDGDPKLTPRVLGAYPTALPEPWIGRRLRALLLDAGFAVVQVVAEVLTTADFARYGVLIQATADAALAVGAITREERDEWVTDQTRRAAADRWFMAFPLFTATAVRRA